MKQKIHTITLGVSNAYLIEGDGLVLVDSGQLTKIDKFLEKLREISIEPNDILLNFITHGHWDHISGTYEIKRISGCKVAVHSNDKEWVERTVAPPPTPKGNTLWGKILKFIFDITYVKFSSFKGTKVDLILDNNDFSLKPYGIKGKLIYTPGHTSGSMTLLLDTGEAFVGDLVMNGPPLRIGPGMTIFADNVETIKESCRILLNKGAKEIYPAHGKSFKADILKKII